MNMIKFLTCIFLVIFPASSECYCILSKTYVTSLSKAIISSNDYGVFDDDENYDNEFEDEFETDSDDQKFNNEEILSDDQAPETGNNNFIFLTNRLPYGSVSLDYRANIFTSSGDFSFSIIDGVLPEGLSLDVSGEIKGTPIKEGEFYFTVSTRSDDINDFELIIYPEGIIFSPEIFSTKIPDGIAGNFYSALIEAEGTAALTWSADYLPDEFSINPDTGVISGVPASEGIYTVKVTAENILSSDTKLFELKINSSNNDRNSYASSIQNINRKKQNNNSYGGCSTTLSEILFCCFILIKFKLQGNNGNNAGFQSSTNHNPKMGKKAEGRRNTKEKASDAYLREAAAEFGCCETTITYVCRKLKITRKKRPRTIKNFFGNLLEIKLKIIYSTNQRKS